MRQISALLQNNQSILAKVQTRLDNSALPSLSDEGLVEYPSLNLQACQTAHPPSSASRLPNAAMAMGRLGRKMFCLEDTSPGSLSPSSTKPMTAAGVGGSPPANLRR